ncbi:DNA-binding MarR family transcriptional regulator [Microbacterium sp. SORGH_AS 421]|nr:DNA-binding MarR family transcriptional regulator [Microbacterium sp. SORGH_AS_0421]
MTRRAGPCRRGVFWTPDEFLPGARETPAPPVARRTTPRLGYRRGVPTASSKDDEVDLLIDAWSQLLPDVDLTPLDVMSRLRRAAFHLSKLRAKAFASADIAVWEFDVLAVLRRAGTELSATRLITATMIGSAAMTNRLDKLAERGLVNRRPNPSDGRAILVAITAEGIERVDAAMTELVRLEADALRDVSRHDQALLASALRVLAAGETHEA